MTAAPPPRFDLNWAGYWTIVFVLNLPVPIVLWHGAAGPSGQIGLLAGLATLYWTGAMLCGRRLRIGRSLVWGGAFVAVSQVIPIFQFLCGAFAVRVWEGTSGHTLGVFYYSTDRPVIDESKKLWDNLGAFVVVLITAWPMWVAAVLLGAFLRWQYRDTPIWRNPSANADSDAS